MKKNIKTTAILISVLSSMVFFQNCGQAFDGTSELASEDNSQFVADIALANKGDTNLIVSEKGTLGVNNPGHVRSVTIEDGKLKILFYKGLRKRDRQGFKRVKYYYDKWHFEFDNQYFGWKGNCGSTKTADCIAEFSLGTIPDLRGKTGKVSVVTYDPLGNYSSSQEGVEVTIPGLTGNIVNNGNDSEGGSEESTSNSNAVNNLPGAANYMYTDNGFTMVLRNVNDIDEVCRVAKPEGKVYNSTSGSIFSTIFEDLKAFGLSQPGGIKDCE